MLFKNVGVLVPLRMNGAVHAGPGGPDAGGALPGPCAGRSGRPAAPFRRAGRAGIAGRGRGLTGASMSRSELDGIVEIENVWIPMPDGCRIAARIWLPEGRRGRAGAGDPRVHPLPQARLHARPRRADPPLFRPPRLCRGPGRPARLGRFRRHPARRVHPAGAGRRARDHRLDRGADVVHAARSA